MLLQMTGLPSFLRLKSILLYVYAPHFPNSSVDENLDYLEARKNKFLLEEKEIVKNLLTENKEELIKMLHLAHLEWEI